MGRAEQETQDLRAYYEREAELGTRRDRDGPRSAVRADFVATLSREGRRSVIDFGAGPGRDGPPFVEAGIRHLGLDLAVGNGHRAADRGLAAVAGSMTDAPLRSASFDAGWSCSALMHLDEGDTARAVDELYRVLRPGAPALVALWGREAEDTVVDDQVLPGSRRPFHLRSFANNRHLLAGRPGLDRIVDVEATDCWREASEGDWDYQLFWLRRR